MLSSIQQHGSGLIYRLPAGGKLLAMLAFAVAVIAFRSVPTSSAALGASLVVATGARLSPRTLWRGLRPIIFVIVILAAIQAWQRGWPTAVELAATTLALVLAATIVTATTPTDEMLDAITTALRPFRRVGVNPDRVALAFSLMIGAIDHIATIGRQTREAAKARGLERSMRAQLSPLLIRTVAHAQRTGEALMARGIGDEPTSGDA